MTVTRFRIIAACAGIVLSAGLLRAPAWSGPASSGAEQLKSTLTPLGAEKAASADGAIPAWTGASGGGGFRDQPFAKETPLLTITGKNVGQYADKLNEGQKAMLAKYPDYSIVVYPTHRTATAPQWVYDATYANASRGKMIGDVPADVYGGIPFPIPKTGAEAMWNSNLRWRPVSWQFRTQGFETGSNGRHVLAEDSEADFQMPYYEKSDESRFNGDYWEIRITSIGPPLRIGEAVSGHQNLNFDKTRSWVYLAGQRRTRGLPNACCDTPAPSAAGLLTFDELGGWSGPTDRYDWKLAGKKEMYVPYNDNGTNAVSSDLLQPHFMNPERVRWELHRVWQVEGTLRPGQRHQSPKATFYLDEDTWTVLLSDRWDAHNQLWKTGFVLLSSDAAGTFDQAFGQYDLLSGTWFVDGLLNQSGDYFRATSLFAEDDFSPQALLRGAR